MPRTSKSNTQRRGNNPIELGEGELVVGLLDFKGDLFAATNRRVFVYIDGVLAPLTFVETMPVRRAAHLPDQAPPQQTWRDKMGIAR